MLLYENLSASGRQISLGNSVLFVLSGQVNIGICMLWVYHSNISPCTYIATVGKCDLCMSIYHVISRTGEEVTSYREAL